MTTSFMLFVGLVLLCWCAVMWALFIEFRAQTYRELSQPESDRGPIVDQDYVSYWQARGNSNPASPCTTRSEPHSP